MSQAVQPIFAQFADILRRAGLVAKVEALHSASNGDGLLAVESLLAVEDSVSDISVTFKLDLERWLVPSNSQ